MSLVLVVVEEEDVDVVLHAGGGAMGCASFFSGGLDGSCSISL